MSLPIAPQETTLGPFHPTLEMTAARAALWHGSQTDPFDRPQVEHLIEVSSALLRLFVDATLAERHAAWLHDLLDDTSVTREDLIRLGYAPEVIQIVEALSRFSAKDPAQRQSIAVLAASAPLGALRVKLAELACLCDDGRPTEAQAMATVGARAEATEQLRLALRRRAGRDDDLIPQPAELIPLVVELEPVDFWVLGEAAAMADRTAGDFMAEEALDLAHRIIATGSLRHVELARDRRDHAAPIMEAFRASDKRRGPLRDFQPEERPKSEDPGETKETPPPTG